MNGIRIDVDISCYEGGDSFMIDICPTLEDLKRLGLESDVPNDDDIEEVLQSLVESIAEHVEAELDNEEAAIAYVRSLLDETAQWYYMDDDGAFQPLSSGEAAEKAAAGHRLYQLTARSR